MKHNMEKINVNDILNAATTVINNPNKKITEILGVGINAIDVGLLIINPSFFVGEQVFKHVYKIVNKLITKKQEKKLMYREIIRKQQAAINKQRELIKELETRLRQQKTQNDSQKKQIDELKEQIENLKDVISVLDEIKAKAA